MNEITPVQSRALVWAERIKAQVQSGQSIRSFCAVQHIKQDTFYYWRKKLSGVRGRFIAISRATHLATNTPRIHLPNGVQIELGAGLESGVVRQFLRGLCGVNNPMPKAGAAPKDVCPPAIGRGHSAKP